nr:MULTISPECIES: hypothetical protein [Rhodococcus erythropolis group]
MSDYCLRELEPGLRASDDKVGGECDFGASTNSVSVDGANDRARRSGHQSRQILQLMECNAQLLSRSGSRGESLIQIFACTKSATRALQHNCTG